MKEENDFGALFHESWCIVNTQTKMKKTMNDKIIK